MGIRKQFAETVAQAYQDQYHWQQWRRRPVMNAPAIDYDADRQTFTSCSTLTPTNSHEVRVLELEDGMFGSDMRITKRDIVQYLMDSASDDLWLNVAEQIAEFASERADEDNA
jgi:hypothetical protein